jgi:hypothetical protein
MAGAALGYYERRDGMSRARHGRQERLRGGRQVRHTVRVTGEQESRLRRVAAEQGVSVSRLLVETALAGEGWTPSQRRAIVRELGGLRRDVEGLGTNVNQIARWANATERFPHEAARVLDAIDRALADLEATVAELRFA